VLPKKKGCGSIPLPSNTHKLDKMQAFEKKKNFNCGNIYSFILIVEIKILL
jgi:hypothetical protein